MQVWDSLINAICRPYRINYKTSELLGGVNGFATISRTKIRRQDFVITNRRDQRLQCSFWEPHDPAVSTKKLPAVIYCHCNSGSRLDAAEAIGIVLPMGVRIFSLDFSGSGISEGDYVTLGSNEVEDLSCLVDFIRAGGHTTTLALWGRSMGAVTSLLYSERDPSVAGLVLDSPFSKLTDLMKELAQEQRIPLWNMVGGTALKLMRRSVKKRAGFDINNIAPVEMVPRSYVPAFFGHAKQDTFVRPHHSERLHSAYAGDKEIMLFDNCDHNSPRPLDFYAASANFLARALQVEFDMQMLPSMMSDTSMLMPNETGQTHSIMPFGQLPFDSAHIPREVREEEGASQDIDDVGVDIELQQALALSLESCAISESVERPSARGYNSRQSSGSGAGGVKEQPFGWGSPEKKIPACATLESSSVGESGKAPRNKCTSAAVSQSNSQGDLRSNSNSKSTGTAQNRRLRNSGDSLRKPTAQHQLCGVAPPDSSSSPPHTRARSCSKSRQRAKAQAAEDINLGASPVFTESPAGCSPRRHARSSGTGTVSTHPQAPLSSHPIGVAAKPGPLARSPAVSPGKRHAVLPKELAKSTKASVWNLFPV